MHYRTRDELHASGGGKDSKEAGGGIETDSCASQVKVENWTRLLEKPQSTTNQLLAGTQRGRRSWNEGCDGGLSAPWKVTLNDPDLLPFVTMIPALTGWCVVGQVLSVVLYWILLLLPSPLEKYICVYIEYCKYSRTSSVFTSTAFPGCWLFHGLLVVAVCQFQGADVLQTLREEIELQDTDVFSVRSSLSSLGTRVCISSMFL